ncbi:mCG121171 [Mus musculus]|jgi:hypothetical protein|uniref:5730446D14Rik protein n=1 Tax=Mus musculus TaxID=10090 RepID=Q52KM3_MOUSE|nr:5730446D14Rik protein [Mus musculus]EDK98650.1 mCG121171 [Mus musculus]
MNREASSVETWNSIACGKSLRPCAVPRLRPWPMGFRCGGMERSPGFLVSASRTCAPPAEPEAGRLCFCQAALHLAAWRPAWAAAGNQAAQRAGSLAFPELRQPLETAASIPRTRRASKADAGPGLTPESRCCRSR